MAERGAQDLEEFRKLYSAPHFSWADKAQLHADDVDTAEKAAELYASESDRQAKALAEAREKVKYHETYLMYLQNGMMEGINRAMCHLRLHFEAKAEAEREAEQGS